MTLDAQMILGAVVVGAGATVGMDLWNAFLRRVFGIPSLNYCLLGRWVGHMPQGTFWHPSISAVPEVFGECLLGWASHYAVGLLLASAFVLATPGWLVQPVVLPALLYGIGTVVLPLFVMQPALGLGMASSRTPKPWAARLKSLGTHTVFGLGLYLSALVFKQLERMF